MPLNNPSKSRNRTDYLETNVLAALPREEDANESQIATGHYRENQAEEYVRREDELIWAWSRDPETDLTQIQARDRAQRHEYGRYNISQSSLSRKLSTLDETMLTGEVLLLDGGRILSKPPEEEYDSLHSTAPSLLDRERAILARYLCDRDALDRFESGGTRTPEWARDRFPELDPNIGRERIKKLTSGTTDSPESYCRGGLHEPHK